MATMTPEQQARVNRLLSDKNKMKSLSGVTQEAGSTSRVIDDSYYAEAAKKYKSKPIETPTLGATATATKEKSFLGKATDFLVGAEKKFGETLGTALSTIDPVTQKLRDDVIKNSERQYANYMKMAAKTSSKTKKEAFLQAAAKSADIAGVDIYNNPEYQKTAKQIYGEGLQTFIDIASAGSVAGFGEGVVKSGVGKKIVKGVSDIGIKEGAKLGAKAGAIYGGASGVATGMQKDEDILGIAGESTKGAITGALIGGATGAVAGKIASRTTSKEQKKFEKIAEQLSPELTGKAKRKAYTQGYGEKVKKSFITREINLSPTDEAEKLAAKFKDVLSHKNDPYKNQQILGKKMKEIETSLGKELAKDKTPIVKRAFNDGLDDLKRKTVLREGKTTYNKAVDYAKDVFSKAEPTIKGLRDARKVVDDSFKRAFPSAVDAQTGKMNTNTPAGAAWKEVRDYMNNYLYDTAKEGSKIRRLIADESDIIRANELLGRTSAKMGGKNIVGRFIEKHPVISGGLGAAGATAVGGVAWGAAQGLRK